MTGDLAAHCFNGCSTEQVGKSIEKIICEGEDARLAQHAAYSLALRNLEIERMVESAAISTTTKPSEWLVPGMVPARALTLLVGKSGHGKDWLAILFAVCVAAGKDFPGRSVRRGKVLLIILESKEINLSRVDPLARGLGTSYEALRRDWLHVYPHALKTDDSASMAQLATWIRLFNYDLIVVDNASEIRSTRSQSSENDATIIGTTIRPLAQLAQGGVINGEVVTTKPPAIVVLHHAGADGQARGSTGFLQHADNVIELRRRNPNNPESPIEIDCGEGSRLAGDGLPIELRFRGFVPDPVVPEIVKHEQPKVSTLEQDPRQRLLDLMRSIGPSTWTAIRAKFGGDPARAAELRDALHDEKSVDRREDGLWHVVDAME
jgi:hypothetical protein